MLPLDDVKVLDFSFHLPGPLASLILAEAGADVIKVERPGTGDELRQFPSTKNGESLSFAMLNRGKRSVALDLKSPGALDRLTPLIRDADVVLEQFRPGVMDRLGFGYEDLRAVNPQLIYCSITGYGQSGPDKMKAAHDLNYCAEAGLLSLTGDAAGVPVLPPTLIADMAGGSYPAVMNILMALRKRDRSGGGTYLDIAMSRHLFTLQYWAIAEKAAHGHAPKAGSTFLNGGSPRYALYRAGDGRYIAAAPLEDRFWQRFCEILELPDELRNDANNPEATRTAVAERIAARSSTAWLAALGADCCCALVATLDEAMENPHFRENGVFAGRVRTSAGRSLMALDTPVVGELRVTDASRTVPVVGEHNGLLDPRG